MLTSVQAHRAFTCELSALLLAVAAGFSQTTDRSTISGTVIDDSTSAVLENVNVFLAHTTLGSSTDRNGHFEIRRVPLGSYEIVASRIGYETRSIRVTLTESGRKGLEIRLPPAAVSLEGVEVAEPDPSEWRTQLEKFTRLFLGASRGAEECKILNPEVLDFSTDERGTLAATARAPLEIDNRSLGYHIQFYLTLFALGKAPYGKPTSVGRIGTKVVTSEGFPKYVEMKAATPQEKQHWKENRLRAFKGSLRQFLISLFNGELKKEGFRMFLEPYVSAAEWNPARREVQQSDILSVGSASYEKIVSFKGILEVEYAREQIEPAYDLLKKKGTEAQVSWLQLNYDAVTVNSRGLIKEWFPTEVYGYWAWLRMADAVALDYEPEPD
jgi:hypothetical protein